MLIIGGDEIEFEEHLLVVYEIIQLTVSNRLLHDSQITLKNTSFG